ncbi:MAG: hypothetical protein ABH863_02735 [Candidatus Micrarchaeota archaeon]
MVRRHLRRLKYRIKGMLLERGSFRFRDDKGKQAKTHAKPAAPTTHHKRELDGKEPVNAKTGNEAAHIPPKIRTLETAYFELQSKGGFHPYRKKGLLARISRTLSNKGWPPLPILVLVALILFASLFPIVSVALLTVEPREVDVLIAVQTLDGFPLKNATIFLMDERSEIKFSAQTGPDGLAPFSKLPVNGKFNVYAQTDLGRRVDVYDRTLTVPYARGRLEIIIVMKAAN